MSWRIISGVPLIVGGTIAISDDCCCEPEGDIGNCCGDWVQFPDSVSITTASFSNPNDPFPGCFPPPTPTVDYSSLNGTNNAPLITEPFDNPGPLCFAIGCNTNAYCRRYASVVDVCPDLSSTTYVRITILAYITRDNTTGRWHWHLGQSVSTRNGSFVTGHGRYFISDDPIPIAVGSGPGGADLHVATGTYATTFCLEADIQGTEDYISGGTMTVTA